ncbi:hypothetical protein EMCRGX_G009913 [Ephydatia muelleri]
MRIFSGLRHLKLIKTASEATLLCSYPGTNDRFELPVDLPNVTVTICENDENEKFQLYESTKKIIIEYNTAYITWCRDNVAEGVYEIRSMIYASDREGYGNVGVTTNVSEEILRQMKDREQNEAQDKKKRKVYGNLNRVVNLLVSGKVPQEVSRFMAGGSLTALSKLKPGCALDIRPIAVVILSTSLAFCPAQSLDPLGHHALTCKCGGDVISRHNALRDTLAHFLHRAHASIEVEAGAGLFPDHSQSRPADILAQHWNHEQPVALDISVVSPLNPGERLVQSLRQRRAGNTRPMMRNA